MTTLTRTEVPRGPYHDTISFSVQRDFSDDLIDLAVDVLRYSSDEQGGCWDERLGPSIELGDAFTLDGRSFKLTPLEREAAELAGIKEIQSRPSYEEQHHI